jgi:hypothetical protein
MASRGYRVTSEDWTRASAERAWDSIIPVDLSQVFTGLKPLIPAVTGTREQTGAWDAAGQTRKIDLADGSETAERIDSAERPHLFTYTVGPFSGPLGRFVDRAEGEFKFTPMNGGTHVRWTYVWFPRRGGAPIVWVLAKLWGVYARRMVVALAKLADLTDPAE